MFVVDKQNILSLVIIENVSYNTNYIKINGLINSLIELHIIIMDWICMQNVICLLITYMFEYNQAHKRMCVCMYIYIYIYI